MKYEAHLNKNNECSMFIYMKYYLIRFNKQYSLFAQIYYHSKKVLKGVKATKFSLVGLVQSPLAQPLHPQLLHSIIFPSSSWSFGTRQMQPAPNCLSTF